MKETTITCDRCGKIVHGGIDESNLENTMTAGYYIVEVGCWGRFKRWEEIRICDLCMFSDPKYQEIYGKSALSGSLGL